jgi:hypothetical protein
MQDRTMPARRILLLILLAAVFAASCFLWQKHAAVSAHPVIEKSPPAFTSRTFDPNAPPPDMPPFSPGELAVCDSNFQSAAGVAGDLEQTDATHAIVTITRVTVKLHLAITIWAPDGASSHVVEHEQGHRQISEHYYETADKLADQIAASYLGKHFFIDGPNLQSEFTKALQQAGTQITEEFNAKLGAASAQDRYDEITDHSRNDVGASDAVSQALKEATASTFPAAAGASH